MEKKDYFNPFEFYSKIIKYNLNSMNRAMEFNTLFFDLAKVKVRNWINESMETQYNTNDIEPEKTTNLEESDELEQDMGQNLYSIMPNPNNVLEDFQEINITLTHNTPITALQGINEETIERLNLFGIHSIKDFTNKNIDEISHYTGISEFQLDDWKRQIEQYMP